MIKNSISVIQEWMGDEFADKTLGVLEKLPDEQLCDLLEKLADNYNSWEDELRKNRPKDLDLLHYGKRFRNDSYGQQELEKQAKLCSLCYTNVAFADPLAQSLHPTIELGQVIPVDFVQARKAMNEGVETLLMLAPLDKIGAITLIPETFLSVQKNVQGLARQELGDTPMYIDLGDGTVDPSPGQLAALSALLTIFELSPVASTPYAKSLLDKCVKDFQSKLSANDFEFENVLSRFEIPNISKVPTSEIVSLRKNSEAFYKCRKTIQDALSTAHLRADAINGKIMSENFEEFFKQQIMEAGNELSKSVTLQDLIIPGGVGLGVGSLSLYLDSSIISDPNKLAIALTGAASPGLVWLITALKKRMSSKHRSDQYLGEIYSYLT